MRNNKKKWNPHFPWIKIGDAVEVIAQPIAGTIDKLTGSKLKECSSCKKRKEWLNNLTK
jgi:hypothetical protein